MLFVFCKCSGTNPTIPANVLPHPSTRTHPHIDTGTIPSTRTHPSIDTGTM